jgi:rare lipoprotein A
MKTTRTICLILLAASLASCVTTNVNQPPYVVESTTPAARRAVPGSEEDAYFEEAARRDPALKETALKEQAETCACKPENAPPGYSDRKETVVENEQPASQEPAPVSSIDLSDYSEDGIASWYGRDFDGRPTASGEPFDSRRLTAAHRTLPLGSVILVKNLDNNKEVIVRINDRGPYVKGRILDVSEYASEVLAFKEKGLTRVAIRLIKKGDAAERGEGATALFFKRPELAEGGAELDDRSGNRDQLAQMVKDLKTEQGFPYYSVQIGLFTDFENALRLKTYLGDRYGQPVHVFRRGNEYVVKAGSFQERYGADQLKSRLEADGYSGFVSSPSK